MEQVVPADIERFVRTLGPEPDAVLAEMDAHAAAQGFPHVGPTVGSTLRLLARLLKAERIFEFGSGFGYSAYWMAPALPADGDLILTDLDAEELAQAEAYLTEGGYDHLATYEQGDALEVVERYDGPFDLVLLDHQKHRYVEAFEAVRSKIPPGGVLVADNAITAEILTFEQLSAFVEGRRDRIDDEATAGIAAYLECVTGDDAFETVVLPVGEGIAVSYRVE